MKNIEYYDILICPNNIKKQIIKENKLLKIKFISIEEFKEKYLYKYKKGTIYYLVNKYNLLPENAKTIMNNLYYIKDVSFKTQKLLNIKKDLEKNDYLIFNDDFKEYIKNKKILVKGYDRTKEFDLLFSNLSVTYDIEEVAKKTITIYECADIDEEVSFVAEEIVDLVSKGTDINKIKIIKSEDIYDGVISRIFSLFNIPYVIKKTSLYNLSSVKKVINNLDKSLNVLELINFIKEINEKNEIKNKIIDILLPYEKNKLSEIYEVFIYELKNTFIRYNYNNYVEAINISQIEDDNKVFILGFNQDVFPHMLDDSDYLSDLEKEKLGLDTSTLKNANLKNSLKKILYKNNIYLSYKLKTPFNKYKISNFYEEIECEIVKKSYNFSNLNLNSIILGQKLDEFIKYNFKDDNLSYLYNNVQIPYNTYNNRYKKINPDILKQSIEGIKLSFSNIDVFYKCQFRFFLENILKIRKNKETVSLEIGNLFHSVLERYYKTKEDINTIIESTLVKDNMSTKDEFYYAKYKKLLLQLINIMDKQLERSDYSGTYFEKWFSIIKDNDLNIKVVGKIDKIMTLTDENNTYVIVVDYKTGLLHADFNKVVYGMDMQLLTYLYLIKNTNVIENPVFTGMYLEPILSNVLKSSNGKTYLDILLDEYKWVGYTIDNIKNVRSIDRDFEINSFIKGLRVKSDNTFYSTSKVLNDIALEKLINITSNNIENVIKCIKESDFKINPKRLGNSNVSCEFCPYKDICYMTNNDIVNLKEYKNLEFLNE